MNYAAKRFIHERRKQIAILSVCLILSAISFGAFLTLLSVPEDGKKTISLQLYIVPKYNATWDFVWEIPKITIASAEVRTQFYNITKKTSADGNEIAVLNFHVLLNESEPLTLLIDHIEPAKGWAADNITIYNVIYENATTQWNIHTYFSVFIAVYTVRSEWLFRTSQIPIFRDAYHFGGSNEVNHYTTERVGLLLTGVFMFASFVIFGLGLAVHKEWRRSITQYYPWLTIAVALVLILTFIFAGTPADIWTDFRWLPSILMIMITYFPHFNSVHLLSNLGSWLIMMPLLESWIGKFLQKGNEVRLWVLALIFLFPLLYWALRMSGVGASGVNEAIGTLLIFYIIRFVHDLTNTNFRLNVFAFLSLFAGYALFRYIVDWFMAGYIFQSDVRGAILHIEIFVSGLLVIAIFHLLPRAVARFRNTISVYHSLKEISMNRREGWALLKASFAIAIIIFFTAVSAEFSVRMYYSNTEPLVQIFSGLIAVFVVTGIIGLILLVFPNQRRAILRMFGMEEESAEKKEEEPEKS